MMEFWILVWLTAAPIIEKPSFCMNVLARQLPDGKMEQFEVFKSTPEIMAKWRTLSNDERATARIFNGNEHKVTEKIVEGKLTPGPAILNCKLCGFYGTLCSYIGEGPICNNKVADGEGLRFCERHKEHGRLYHGVE